VLRLCAHHSSAPSSTTHETNESSKGRKRAFESLVQAEYSKYGVTDGVLISRSEKRSCAVLIKGWPGWCMAATTRGWDVKLIIVKENEWLLN